MSKEERIEVLRRKLHSCKFEIEDLEEQLEDLNSIAYSLREQIRKLEEEPENVTVD